jgi:hypothetical protein
MKEVRVSKWILNTSKNNFDILGHAKDSFDIHEQETCSFTIQTMNENKPEMRIGDYAVEINLISEVDGIYTYKTSSAKCFKNFIGLTNARLYFSDLQTEIMSNSINVFAGKATYDRALSFLKLISRKSDISSHCFSITSMASDNNKSAQNLSAMLRAGIQALDYFQENRNRFAQYPCSKTETKSTIKQYNKSTHLNDQSIAYLCSNPESLSLTYASEADVVISGKNYQIGQIQSLTHYKNTDVYENQVIVGFIQFFFSYLRRVKTKLQEQRISKKDVISFDNQNYISIDRLLSESGLILDFHQDKINSAIEKCSLCLSFIDKHIPCKRITDNNLNPVPSQQVLARTHYLQLFGLIKNFYDIGEPQWRGQLEFFGLRNLSKIYEFVCLINLIEGIKSLGYELEVSQYLDRDNVIIIRPINEPSNFYRFRNLGETIELYYEPYATQYSKLSSSSESGTLVDVTHSSIRTWIPDFVMVSIKDNKALSHIFDAKYSNYKTVKDFHLNECALKYTTKLMKLDDNHKLSKVDSMHILYSGDHYFYESYYINQLSFYDQHRNLNNSALFPVIGSLSLNENNSENLNTLVKDLLSFT